MLEPAHTDVKTPGPLYLKAEDEGNQTEEATKEGGGEDDKGLVAPKEVDDKVASEDKGGGTKDVVPSAVTNKGEEGKKAKKLRYPLQVGPILLMEACERYSYYGMMGTSERIDIVKKVGKPVRYFYPSFKPSSPCS